MAVDLTPVAEPGLVSLDRVRRVLRTTAGKVSAHDDLLTDWIIGRSRQFERECCQTIRAAGIEWVFEGNGSASMLLPHHPVSNLVKLEYRADLATWTELNAADYTLLLKGSTLWHIIARFVFDPRTTYRATYTVGYANVPGDVEDLILNAVVLDYLDSPVGGGRLGVTAKTQTASDGGGDTGFTLTLDPKEFKERWRRTVRRYQRRSMFA